MVESSERKPPLLVESSDSGLEEMSLAQVISLMTLSGRQDILVCDIHGVDKKLRNNCRRQENSINLFYF